MCAPPCSEAASRGGGYPPTRRLPGHGMGGRHGQLPPAEADAGQPGSDHDREADRPGDPTGRSCPGAAIRRWASAKACGRNTCTTGASSSTATSVSRSRCRHPFRRFSSNTVPWTVGLIGISTIISFVLGTLVGTMLGWRRGSRFDAVLPLATFFQAVPYFFLGTVVLLLFGSDLHWFPVLGAYDQGDDSGVDVDVRLERRPSRRAARASPSFSAPSPAGSWVCAT